MCAGLWNEFELAVRRLSIFKESYRIMDEIMLTAQHREVLGKKVRHLRKEGLIPVVLYGREIEPQPLQIPLREIESVLQQAESAPLVKLQVTGADAPVNILIRDVQRDILNGSLMHADLYQVVMSEEITAEVPIVLEGTAPAVTNLIGVLVQGLNSVQVQCLPADLIPEITVDISGLEELRDSILVSDLDLGEKISILAEPDDMIATITTMRAEEEEEVEELDEFDMMGAEPELVGEEGEEMAEPQVAEEE